MDNRSAIVSFNIERVSASKDLLLSLFAEMDDGIDMSKEHKAISSKALLARILSEKEIHLLAIEADYLKERVPELVIDIKYYD